MDKAGIPREHQDVLVAMGVTLLMLQVTETCIKTCLTLVLPGQPFLTLEVLEQQDERLRNKTLGYFLTEVRKRVDLDDDFDALLKAFLKNRNDFVHDLSRVPGWKLGSPEETAKARAFVHHLLEQADMVQKVFLGLMSAWLEQTGMKVPLPSHPLFDEIDAVYKPLVDQIFSNKSS
jgi:hypothetical protein